MALDPDEGLTDRAVKSVDFCCILNLYLERLFELRITLRSARPSQSGTDSALSIERESRHGL